MKTRPLLLRWHRWFGLAAALWLGLLALTGSILVFYDELDTALNRDQRLTEPRTRRAPLAALVAAAEAAYPGSYARFVDLPNGARDTARVFLVDRSDSAPALEHETHVFVDPYTAEIAGERVLAPLAADRGRLMDFLYGLHVDLHLGGAAIWLLGLLAALWVLDHAAATVLSFPKAAKWQRSFAIRRAARAHVRSFDLHRAGGLWLFPLTLVLAFSGAYLNWYDYFEHAAELVSDVTPGYPYTLPDLPAPDHDMAVSIDAAVAAARRAGNGADVDMISIMPAKGVYQTRVFDARDIDPYGRRFVTVDGTTGRVLDDRHIVDGTAADVVFAWQYPLHSGKAFGWPGRITVFVAGLGVVLLCVTGVGLWRRKQGTGMRVRSARARGEHTARQRAA